MSERMCVRVYINVFVCELGYTHTYMCVLVRVCMSECVCV